MQLGQTELKTLLESGKAVFINCNFPQPTHIVPFPVIPQQLEKKNTFKNSEEETEKLISYIKDKIDFPTMNDSIIKSILDAEIEFYKEYY